MEVESPGAHWIRGDAMPNAGGVPPLWESPAAGFQGSFTSCVASADSLTLRVFNQSTDGTFLGDHRFSWAFAAPPPIILPDTGWPLSVQGELSAEHEGGGYPFSRFQFAISFPSFPDPQGPAVFQSYNGFGPAPLLEWPGITAASDVGIGWALSDRGSEVRIRAGASGHPAGSCAVEWSYTLVSE